MPDGVAAAKPPTASERRLRRLIEGPIAPTLARLAAPNVAVVTAQTAISIADAWFVGRLGTVPLAALAMVFPVQALMGMMSAGAMGGGVSSAIARALGGGSRARAEAVVVHALLIALGMAALYVLLAAVLARPLFALLGGSGAALDGAVAYAHIAFGGAAAVWLANTLASVLRGTGDMLSPALALIAGSVLHIALSGALTLGWAGLPSLGVRGPAVAFVASFAVAAAMMLHALGGGRAGLRLRWRGIRLQRALFRDILRVGAVACGNALLTISTIVVVTGLVGRYGTEALAGYGLGSRLELMLIPIAFGVGGALTAMVGANRGARHHARARRVAWIGALFAGAVTGLVGIVFGLFPELWIDLFTADAAAAAYARAYLGIVGPFYGFFGLGMALYFASQGTGSMTWPFLAGSLRMVAAAAVGFALAVWWAAPIEAVFACVAAGLVLFGGLIAWSLTTRVWNPER